MFTYIIHNLESGKVHNVNEKFVLSWLKADQEEHNPKSELERLKKECLLHGHVQSGNLFGGSYLVMTKNLPENNP